MTKRAVEFDDIQGLVRFGYKRLTQACFLLYRIKNRAAARAWLAAAPVATAETAERPPQTALQVALSCQGLHALGVPEDIIARFSPEFVGGMADRDRSRRLGDYGPNGPDRWRWGGTGAVPDVLVLLYAVPGGLDDLQRSVTAQCADGFDLLQCLTTSDMDGVEPFGFVDGIAQPRLDWERERPAEDHDVLEYSNIACLGEFLLGYPNEYGRYTDRPLLDPERDAAGALPRAEEMPQQADLGRNGTYLVMRQLRQDVRGFWRFLDATANGDAGLRQRLAEAMVGRTMGGDPLVGPGAETIPGIGPDPDDVKKNSFTYLNDAGGTRCPFGAHIRRSNPRNGDLPSGASGLIARLIRTLGFSAAALREDQVASTRFHRVLRRGREYGTAVPLAQALTSGAGGDGDTGLHFICLGANLARQFEFVQSAWLNGRKFDGLRDENDPLVGNRRDADGGVAIDTFSLPQASGPDRCMTGLPQFVSVRGGAYFFLPGIRALRFLASLRT
jgi:deferrochelatase/peroxidase EfeB